MNNVAIQRNYSSKSITITWDSLPSLDLTDSDPDIIYTIKIFKITCGHNVSISHEVVTGSTITKENLDLMQIYKVVIAARNNVSGAENGPSVEMEGIINTCVFHHQSVTKINLIHMYIY